MAAGHRAAAGELTREERLAAVLVDRFDLEPPVDIAGVAERYADLDEDDIPSTCDGIVIGLNQGRPRPLILVKPGRTARLRFTMAHELGHVLLPWHVAGEYLCDPQAWTLESYHAAEAEAEANRFASHILMPSRWLTALLVERGDEQITPLVGALEVAKVSAQAACLRLLSVLSPGHVFAVTDSSRVVLLSGQTKGTGLEPPVIGDSLNADLLDRFCVSREESAFGARRVIWWKVRGRVAIEQAAEDPRPAKEVLAEVLGRYFDDQALPKLRQSIGGVVGYENGMARRDGVRGAEELYARFRGKFAKARDYPKELLEDPEFDLWIQKRAVDLGDS